MLTNAAVKAARPRATAYKIFDGRGLHLYVSPSNLRAWRWRFRFGGKEQLLTIGSAFEMSLDQARARCDQLREQLGRGEDPRTCEIAQSGKARAFEDIARRWHAHMRHRWTEKHAGDVLGTLERYVFPAIGAMPIGTVTVPVLLNALRVIEERQNFVTAGRVRQRMSAVFAYAMAHDLADNDPAAIVRKALTPPAPAKNHNALLEIEDARALLAAAELVDVARVVKLASRFLAMTAVRFAAVREARWEEIEDLDGAAPIGRVPAARMKLKLAKKLDAKNDHPVPLSRQAVALLREVWQIMHQDDAYMHQSDANFRGLIFRHAGGRRIGEKSIGALYDRAGFEGRHVPHGWRATFSTVMNERGADSDDVERALAHAMKDKVKAAYDRSRSERLQRLRDLFQEWADLLLPASSPAD